MSSDALTAAQILCDVKFRQKFRQIDSNFQENNFTQNHHLSTPLGPRVLGPPHACVPRVLSLSEGSSSISTGAGRNPLTTGERPAAKSFGSLKVDFAQSSNSKDWSYSPVTGKLYAARNKRIRVGVSDPGIRQRISVDKENSFQKENLFVRILLAYGSDQHITRPVVRCQQHLDSRNVSRSPNDVIDLSPASKFFGGDESEHVVRCFNADAKHVKDQVSGRFSVIVPFKVFDVRHHIKKETGIPMENDEDSIELELSFGCLNTCLGAEYSLRNWNLIFTLENSDSTLVGRQVVPVKVCAAPKRERAVEEEHLVRGKSSKRCRSSLEEDELRKHRISDSPKMVLSISENSSPDLWAPYDKSDLNIAVNSKEEFLLLTAIRDELRQSPLLKEVLQAKLLTSKVLKAVGQ